MDEFRQITQERKWDIKIDELINQLVIPDEFRVGFLTYWTEAGHRIREQVHNDNKLILFLRMILPAYTGEDITLYRGENIERFNKRQTGLFWTPKIEIAEMFASGLNSIEHGGLLLKAKISSNAIISSPSNHSIYLGEFEYTVDASALMDIEILQKFPASHLDR